MRRAETALRPDTRSLGRRSVRTVPSPVVTSRRQLDPSRVDPRRFIDRRTVLRGGLGLGAATFAGGLLAGCGDDTGTDTAVVGNGTPDNALIAAFPQSVPHAAAGVATRLPYLLSDPEGVPLQEIDGPVRFTVAMDGAAVGTAIDVTPRSDGVPRAYLPFTFEFPQPGVYDVSAEYGGNKLDSTIQVYDVAQIGPPVVGEQLPPVDSPTTLRPLDVDPLCSRVPACPFHDVNLQDAVGAGKPVVLLVATPAYCQTAVCGPVLDMLVEAVGSRTDIAVLHNEVYKNPKDVRDLNDAALAQVPQAYDLRFEPVLFVTNAAGTVVARADITVDRTEMAELLALAR